MTTSEIKYVTIRPDGTIQGPVADTEDLEWQSLEEGHRRAGKSGRREDIELAGYKVVKARITVIE